MGLCSEQCVTVGYSYFLDFAYVYAEKFTNVYRVMTNGDEGWVGDLSSDGIITFVTGKTNDTFPSEFGESDVMVHFGGQTPFPKMQEWTGSPINYNNVCGLAFPQVFIGDGVRNIPTYEIVAANDEYQKVVPSLGADKANPINVIYDIVKRDLQYSDNSIDVQSFIDCANTINTEGIYVGLVMGSEKQVKRWIDELLKIVDGVLYFDHLTNKIGIKLLRADYNPDDVLILNDNLVSKITMDVQSWADTYNSFTFKYTDGGRGKIGSIKYTNTASKIALGFERSKTIQLPLLNNLGVVGIVANRMAAKLGSPKTAVKLQVDYIDFPSLTLGSVFKLNSASLGVSGKIFRVMKITGDSEDKSYVNVEAVEDFYAKNLSFDIPVVAEDKYIPPVYNLTTPPTHFKAIDAFREQSTAPAVLWMAGKPLGADIVFSLTVTEIGGASTQGQYALYGTLASNIPNPTDYSDVYSKDYTFVVTDVDNTFFDIAGTDTSMQHLVHTLLIGEEAIGFTSMTTLGNGNYELTGITRGLGGSTISSHSSGEDVYINPTNGGFASTLRIINESTTLSCYASNHQSVSPKAFTTVNYNRTIEKPYPVTPFIKNGDIVWRPRVALAGANYRSTERIVAGEDEGKVTGYYVVKEPNGNEVTITPQFGDILITFTPTQSGVHQIKHCNSTNHYFDGWASITV